MDENGNWQGVDRGEEEMMQVDDLSDDSLQHPELDERQVEVKYYRDIDNNDEYSHDPQMTKSSAPVAPFHRYLFTSPRHNSLATPASRSLLPLPQTVDSQIFFRLCDGGNQDGGDQGKTNPVSPPLTLPSVLSPPPPTTESVPQRRQGRELKGILKKGGTRSSRYDGEDMAKAFYAKYEPREILGKGLCSTVRVALDKVTSKEVAVKVIDVAEAAREQNVTPERIRQESCREIQLLELCRRSRQPNIVKLIDHYETTAYIFLIFELCKEGDMFDFLNNGFHCSEKRTRYLMRQLLQVVDFLHSHRIVHRDLKLENILVTTVPATTVNKDVQPVIKVADFGFAANIPEGQQLYERQGTLPSMAPEVISATEDVGYSLPIDLWACGVIMYTLLCGFPPFWSRNRAAMIRDILAGRYCFRSPLWDDISDTPKDLISNLLVVNPSRRFTAREALNHPFFHMEVGSEKKVFKPRAVFRAASFAIRFYFRLRTVHARPPALSAEMILQCPYSLKDVRTLIDSTAFRMYGHWVKRGGNQNRALLFQHEKRG